MTRQDYIRIGDALKSVDIDDTTTPETLFERVTIAIADAFKADNPRFDEARFRTYVEAS